MEQPASPPPQAPQPSPPEPAVNRLLGLVLVGLVIAAGVVVTGSLRGRSDAPPAPAAAAPAVEVDGRPFRLEPYLEDLVVKERSSGARFDQLIAAYRAGSLSEANLKSSMAREVIAPYAQARSRLKDLPPFLPDPMKEHIARVLSYVDLRGELWLTESRRVTQPGLGDRSLLTDDDVARLAAARDKSELDKVVLPATQ